MMADKEETTEEVATKPHSFLFHPYMTWFEVFLQFILPFILPLNKMLKYSQTEKSEEALASINKTRKTMSGLSGTQIKPLIDRWSKCAKSPIAEYTSRLPVRSEILQSWGIVSDIELPSRPNDEVIVLVRFPSSLLTSETTSGGETENGCVKVESLDLASFAMDVPIMVNFHGGGMTLGIPGDPETLGEAVALAEAFLERDGSGGSSKPLISVSVDYSLAPEGPFPLGVIDALSVVDFFITSNPNRKIHISGISAGGNLALVSGLEAHRKYPGRVTSIHAHSPMLGPAADSMSYYMNSYASKCPDVRWLRWCWQSYLGMEPVVEKVPDLDIETKTTTTKTTTTEQLLREGSNYTLWQSCKWSKGATRRLVDPSAADLPDDLRNESNSMKIFIITNRADPLRDEGNKMAKCLEEAGANVTLYEHNGPHVTGSAREKESNKIRLETWLDAIYG